MKLPVSKREPPTIPATIGKYEIRGLIGRGAMGMVYEGFDPFVQRRVAIKVSRYDPSSGATVSKNLQHKFFSEAHAAGALQHPHIVSVYDAGIDEQTSFIVMEYVEGETLDKYLAEGKRLSVEKVIDIIFKCCKALDYAHGHGVIHRDIKPSNIMLSRDHNVKIMDFGIAKLEQDDDDFGHGLVGSPDYMSPEQAREEPVDARSDLYSLSVVMFQLLSGKLPFRGENIVAMIHQIANVAAPSLQEFSPGLPDDLIRVVDRGLIKDKRRRYQSGQAFAEALSRAFDNLKYAEHRILDRELRDRISSVSFFDDFTAEAVNELMRAATWAQFESGDTIMSEDDIDNTFYVIVEGNAEVSRADHLLYPLSAGDSFGEVGLVTQQQRDVTVTATSRLMLMKVNTALMDQTSEHCQAQYYKAITTSLINRLSSARRQVLRQASEKVARQTPE